MSVRLSICWPLLALTSLANCGPRQPAGQEQPGPQDSAVLGDWSGKLEQLSGKVFVTGAEPWTSITLVPTKGRGVTLVGDLEGELARLSGAEVRVHGLQRGEAPAGGFDVESYEVLEVDGEVPKVGTLRARDGTLMLAGRDTVQLANPPEELREKEGAKVWIVGAREGERLTVQSYGIIREAGR